jgi:hypothetical protein
VVTADSELRRKITSQHFPSTLTGRFFGVRWIGNWVNSKTGFDVLVYAGNRFPLLQPITGHFTARNVLSLLLLCEVALVSVLANNFKAYKLFIKTCRRYMK